MPIDLIQYAFVSGELSPQIHGRTDLEKYDLGLAKAYNWFVDYRGGISTRPGTEFCEHVTAYGQDTKFFRFQYAPDIEDTYLVVFGNATIRFIQDGSYVIEGNKVITGISKANPGVVTSAAHGYSNGDLIYITNTNGMEELNDVPIVVAGATTDTFEVHNIHGLNLNTSSYSAYVNGGVANRVYTVASPYTGADLALLQAEQRLDLLRLTHPDFAVRNLIRTSHTSWALSLAGFASTVVRPSGLTGGATDVGTAQVGFVVTTVDGEGRESLPSDMLIIEDIVNYAATAGAASIKWGVVAGAQYYNVYRTNIAPAEFTEGASDYGGITKGEQVGFVGRAYGPQFTDPNIVPDFTRAPPLHHDPFADGAIDVITMTAGGAGYAKDTATVSIAGGGGSGFVGIPVVDENGTIKTVLILTRGEGYVNPVVSFGGGGAGATANATATVIGGNNPRTSAIFQQRQIYASTDNQPLTVFGSQIGFLNNMSASSIVTDSDAFELEIESKEVAPIRHMLDARGGLLLFSQSMIWLLRAASAVGANLNANDVIADPQSARGSSEVTPIPIDSDFLYVEGKNVTVRLLSYQDGAKGFVGLDMSILSNHLFGSDKRIVRMDFAQNPHNLVVAVRSDGQLLFFTLVREQDVYAWTPGGTSGLVKDVCVLHENGRDSIYLMVQRKIQNRWIKYIERVAAREFSSVEEAWCVDCGLRTTLTYPAFDIEIAAATGASVNVKTTTLNFTVGDVGKILRFGGGMGTVIAFVNANNVTIRIDREITDIIPDLGIPRPAVSGEWSMTTPFTNISGLKHLEGEEVSILADGNVVTGKTVVDGEVTLDNAATLVVAGLPYTCTARTLPPTIGEGQIEARRKGIVGSAVRVHDTRGLKVGTKLTKLREMRERTDEPYGQAIRLQTGMKHMLIDSVFDDNGQTYYVQDQPLPATVIGLVTRAEVGDQ